jgi:hypothetical protein
MAIERLSKRKIDETIASARQFMRDQDYILANGALITVLASNPLHSGALYLRARLLAAMNDFPGAFSNSCVLVSVEPEHSANWQLRGKLAREVGFKHIACESFNHAIELGDKKSQLLLEETLSMTCVCEFCKTVN